MPTVQEVLRESGFSENEIAALDGRAITAFSGVLSQAQLEREAAELAQRSNVDFYENKIAPSLVQWEEEKQQLENDRARVLAEAAFYRTQAEEAKKVGFIPADAPGFQPRDIQGRYVSGVPGGTPGSPQFFDVNKVYERAGDAVGVIADIEWEHRRLFDQSLPISPRELIRRADAAKLDPATYASRTFNWDQRRAQVQQKQQEAHDQKIRTDAIAENDKKWAERVGSNPDVHIPQSNPRMTDVARAVRGGQRPDPLTLGELERRQATRSAIRTEMAEEAR